MDNGMREVPKVGAPVPNSKLPTAAAPEAGGSRRRARARIADDGTPMACPSVTDAPAPKADPSRRCRKGTSARERYHQRLKERKAAQRAQEAASDAMWAALKAQEELEASGSQLHDATARISVLQGELIAQHSATEQARALLLHESERAHAAEREAEEQRREAERAREHVASETLRADAAEWEAAVLAERNRKLEKQVMGLRAALSDVASLLADVEILSVAQRRTDSRVPFDAIPSIAGDHFRGYKRLGHNHLALLSGHIGAIVLREAALPKKIPADKYFAFIREVLYLMNPLKRHHILVDGTTVGIGHTKKYKFGSPVEEFCVRSDRRPRGKFFLHEVNPAAFEVSIEIVMWLTDILGRCLPPAFLERIDISRRFRLPLIGGSFSTGAYVTRGFRAARHRDKDKGRAFAIAVILEEHKSNCPNKGTNRSCRKNWAFFIIDLGVLIPLCHGTILVWDSENLEHGTVCDGFIPGGCKSEIYVIVSQIKSAHLMQHLKK